MTQFNGFPARAAFTPIPKLFFSSLLPQIDNIAELKVTLHIFWAAYSKKGYLRFVTYRELLADKSLMKGLKAGERLAGDVLGEALEMAVKRGTILHLALVRDGAAEDVYFLNSEADRRVVEKIKNGELALTGLKATGQSLPDANVSPPPDIFTAYEQNIGMLTPLIAEELSAAEKLYPADWIRDAIKEAVSLNKRNWRYIERILERWSAEGRRDGTHRRDPKASADKFSKQKYGHLIQH